MRLAPPALDSPGGLVSSAALVALPLALGVAIASEPRLAPPLILLIGVAIWVSVRGRLVWWDMLVFTIAGLYILDNGFANVGIQGPLPLPLVDLIAVALVIRIATQRAFRWPDSLPFVLAAAFAVLTGFRLFADYPVYGGLAIRDATLGLELAFLVIGYWAVHEFGLARIVRLLTIVFLVGLVYVMLYPARDTLVSVSPVVGLQRPIPLIGAFEGNVVHMSAFFFFVFLRPFGGRSYLLAAATLPVFVILQSRGMYLAVPAAICLVVVLARARAGAQLRRGLAVTLGVGVVAVLLFLPVAPEGRLGETANLNFIVAQLATLAGDKGPGTPVETRTDWFDKVIKEVEQTPGGWLYGVGLGPDLAFGFKNYAGVLVRKPHNDFLEVYGRYGLLGFLIFVTMLGVAFVRVVGAARIASGFDSRFLWFAVAQSFVLIVIAATQPLLAFAFGTMPLFFVLGAALAIRDQRAELVR